MKKNIRRSAQLELVPLDKTLEFGELCLNLHKEHKEFVRSFVGRYGKEPDIHDIFAYWMVEIDTKNKKEEINENCQTDRDTE